MDQEIKAQAARVTLPIRVRFGEFEANFRTRILYRGEEPVRLQEKPLQVLAALLERAGSVVTREEIRARVWPDDDSLDFDANLNTALNKLRRALGDVHEQPLFIRTIPRTGYCFIAPTTALPEQGSETQRPGTATPVQRTASREIQPLPAVVAASVRGTRRWAAASLGFLSLVIALVALRFLQPYTSWASRPPGGRSLLLVLPFDSPGGNAADASFADGLADELMARMASVNPPQLGVIARTTAVQYRGAHKTAEQIGRELHVDYLLEGTVRREGQRERVFLWLVRTRDQVPVWAETYDRVAQDILSVEEGISSHVAAVLSAKFFGDSAIGSPEPGPANPAAHENYLLGRYFWNRMASSDLEKALTLFQKAIEKDPSYAEAYAGTAETYAVLADWSLRAPAQTLPAARDAARRALDHDPSLSEAHAVLGVVAWQYDRDWSQAEAEFARAIQLSPTNPTAHQWRGEYLAARGRFSEAIGEMERARQLDPLSRFIATGMGYTYYLGKDYERAIPALQRALELDPDFYPAHAYLSFIYMQKGMGREFARERLRLLEINREGPEVVESFRRAAAPGKLQPMNQWLLDRLLELRKTKYVTPWRIATYYVALGQKDAAFQWMEKAMEEHDPEMARLRVDPMLDSLRGDPRFQGYLDRLNLR
jgi:TolB-like protein/DNA-binding winged helix-turn-helix (wHTH) protein/Tfp pilus assembly protein PilF